jgi:tetratricopeptide (TPR) repeat protein
MLRSIVFCMGLIMAVPAAFADAAADCNQDDDNDRTINGCTALIEKGAPDISNYRHRGDAYHAKCLDAEGSLPDCGRAIADYTKAIALDPKYDDAYIARGRAYSRIGDHDRAMADFNKALDVSPGNPGAYCYRADEYLRIGDREHAEADRKLAEINDEDPTSEEVCSRDE